jgi:hypothetical protein
MRPALLQCGPLSPDTVSRNEPQIRPMLQEHISCCLLRVDADAICSWVAGAVGADISQTRRRSQGLVARDLTVRDYGTRLSRYLEL